jgi:F0F1-type ATP synthase epsilon subunit
MNLQVLSLQGIQYDGKVKSVNAQTTSGQITVLDHHLPLITVLKKGKLTIKDIANKETVIPTMSGFLEVAEGNKANVLIS